LFYGELIEKRHKNLENYFRKIKNEKKNFD
jgi:hypothetical protein